ncbi:MBL fold metallo-hydrolase [Pedobacter sp.]|nr:MBL fold metallo-hydrolase [Candidatus Saccharibacteria bacterium]
MDISYHGANSVQIVAKKSTIITDGALSRVGLKDVVAKEAIYLNTHTDFIPAGVEGIIVDGPGEYEIKDISIKGVPAIRMTDHDGSRQATMYRVVVGDISIAVLGHVVTPLTDDQLELLGVIDIAIIPVGGSGYTLDSHQAVLAVRQLDPKVVIPTHYADDGIKYEVEQNELEPFIKELSALHEVTAKYKIKNGILPETMTVMEITRS